MDDSPYIDFDLAISRSGRGYKAVVLKSPGGEAGADFTRPFTKDQLDNFILTLGVSQRHVRRMQSPEVQTAEKFGERLFEKVFAGDVGTCFNRSLDLAKQQKANLRIRLRLDDAPGVSDWPWEFLFDRNRSSWLALDRQTSLVRYVRLGAPVVPLTVAPPLRVLVMISSPASYPPLETEREWNNLTNALSQPLKDGLVTLERLDKPTLPALNQRSLSSDYHIFHFVGHGTFDQHYQEGVLLLEDQQGQAVPVPAHQLAPILHNYSSLRLAVLNACEGARTSATDPFAGLAHSLLQQGIPAVVGMQSEITDQAAIAFSSAFYSALAANQPMDGAMTHARAAIWAEGNQLEWGVPVLHMRSADGRIFDVSPSRDPFAPQYREAVAAMEAENWHAGRDILATIVLQQPHYRDAATKLRACERQIELAAKKKAQKGSRLPADTRTLALLFGLVLVVTVGLNLGLRLVGAGAVQQQQASQAPVGKSGTHHPFTLNLAHPVAPLHAPSSGSLAQRPNTLQTTLAGTTGVGDYEAGVRFYNPGSRSAPWDYGFVFRRSGINHEYRLYVDSSRHWYLTYGLSKAPTAQRQHRVPNLDVSSGGHNDLLLIVAGKSGVLFVNNTYVATFDVSKHLAGGDVGVGTGFLTTDIAARRTLKYTNFTVWSASPTYVQKSGSPIRPLLATTGPATWNAFVSLRNSIAYASILNPNTAKSWDYGFFFRRTATDQQSAVIVSSDGYVRCYLDQGDTNAGKIRGTQVCGERVTALNLRGGATNNLLLYVVGHTATLFVNGKNATSWDVSHGNASGSVLLASNDLAVDTAGVVPAFQNFSVWSLDS